MSMETIRVLVPTPPPVPRGAVLVGAVLDWALAAVARERVAWAARWARAEARRRRDAERAVRRLVRDRAALVALARRYEASQPEFAKDLHAAALVDREA